MENLAIHPSPKDEGLLAREDKLKEQKLMVLSKIANSLTTLRDTKGLSISQIAMYTTIDKSILEEVFNGKFSGSIVEYVVILDILFEMMHVNGEESSAIHEILSEYLMESKRLMFNASSDDYELFKSSDLLNRDGFNFGVEKLINAKITIELYNGSFFLEVLRYKTIQHKDFHKSVEQLFEKATYIDNNVLEGLLRNTIIVDTHIAMELSELVATCEIGELLWETLYADILDIHQKVAKIDYISKNIIMSRIEKSTLACKFLSDRLP